MNVSWEKSYRKLLVQVDNKNVVDWNQRKSVPLQGLNLIRKIHQVGSNFGVLRFEQSYREINRYADLLDKQGCLDIRKCTWYIICLNWLRKILVDDLKYFSIKFIA